MAFYFSYDASTLFDLIEKNLTKTHLLYAKEKMHCTMLYSYGEYQASYQNINLPDLKVQIKNIEIFHGHDSKYSLVAILDNPLLFEFNKQLKNKTFQENTLSSDFEFNPHITLQQDFVKENLLDIENLNFLSGAMVQLNNFHCIAARQNKSLKI